MPGTEGSVRGSWGRRSDAVSDDALRAIHHGGMEALGRRKNRSARQHGSQPGAVTWRPGYTARQVTAHTLAIERPVGANAVLHAADRRAALRPVQQMPGAEGSVRGSWDRQSAAVSDDTLRA